MRTIIMTMAALAVAVVTAAKHNCQCPCPCKPNGTKLRDMINCFGTWAEDVAHDGWNSYTEGCADEEIIHCRLAKPDQEIFCKFDGTNNLIQTDEHPNCFYNCGMQTCDAFLIAHAPNEVECIAHVFNG